MKIIKKKIPINQLKVMAQKGFGNLVKAVVDTQKEIIALDAELHADEEAILLENGSKQENLWGINLYPELKSSDWIEFDSMINLRPSSGNRSRGVDSPKIKEKIISIVNKLVEK
jgi:hypothetical protein